MLKLATYISIIFSVCNAFTQGKLTDRINYIDSTIKVDQNNVPRDKKTFYFPTDFFPMYKLSPERIDSSSFLIGKMWSNIDDNSKLHDTIFTYSTALSETVDTFHLECFSEQLFALKEPLLFNKKTNKETYRFTWLRTFDNPISLRIEKDEYSIWIYSKVGRGAGGYPPKKSIKSVGKKKVSNADWEEFKRLLEELNFWNTINHGSFPSADGAQWILEGSTTEKYSVLRKKSQREGTAFYKTCRFLIDLSKVHVRKDRIY